MPVPVVDLVLGVFLLGFLVNGYRRGFILTIGQLIGIIVGFVLARLWSPFVLSRVTMLVPQYPAIAYLVSFIGVFVVMDRAVAFLFHLVHLVFKILTIIPFLETINRLAGAILGLLTGVVFIGGATYLLFLFRIDPRWMLWAAQSRIALWSQALVLPVIQRFL
jgi:uncharacterized membrane protein required for colicin V production